MALRSTRHQNQNQSQFCVSAPVQRLDKEAFLDASCIGPGPTEPLSRQASTSTYTTSSMHCTANTDAVPSPRVLISGAQPKTWSPDYVIHDGLYRILLSALPNAASSARVLTAVQDSKRCTFAIHVYALYWLGCESHTGQLRRRVSSTTGRQAAGTDRTWSTLLVFHTYSACLVEKLKIINKLRISFNLRLTKSYSSHRRLDLGRSSYSRGKPLLTVRCKKLRCLSSPFRPAV